MKTLLLSVILGASFVTVSAHAADLKNCRYSNSLKEDQYDNQRVSMMTCNSRLCAAVVVCDGGKSASNVVCAMTAEGCPAADDCLKQHQANGIKFGAFASTPYKEVVQPDFPGDGGMPGAR